MPKMKNKSLSRRKAKTEIPTVHYSEPGLSQRAKENDEIRKGPSKSTDLKRSSTYRVITKYGAQSNFALL